MYNLADLCVVFAAIGLFDQHKFFFMHNAAMKTTDADTAFVAAMVDGAHLQSNRRLNLHLGGGNLGQNGIEQRHHVHVAVVGIEDGRNRSPQRRIPRGSRAAHRKHRAQP